MKLVFPTTFDYPTRFAHPIYGLRMARAFASILGDDFIFTYGQTVDPELFLRMRTAPMLGRWPRRIKKLRLRRFFVFAWLLRFLRTTRKDDIIFYVIDRQMASLLLFLKHFFHFRIIFEYHDFYKTSLDRKILAQVDVLIFLTQALAEEAQAFFPPRGIQKIIGGGIDLAVYEEVKKKSVAELRKIFNLPHEKFIIGYFGRFRPLGLEKGIAALITASRELPDDALILCVGGVKEEMEYYQKYIQKEGNSNRVRLLLFTDPDRIPAYQAACDALVYIPSAHSFFQRTFPMKLLEYMAAQKPIVVSDTPSFRELLSDETAYFIPSENSQAFIKIIMEIRAHPETARQKAKYAFDQAGAYSWEKRARAILCLI